MFLFPHLKTFLAWQVDKGIAKRGSVPPLFAPLALADLRCFRSSTFIQSAWPPEGNPSWDTFFESFNLAKCIHVDWAAFSHSQSSNFLVHWTPTWHSSKSSLFLGESASASLAVSRNKDLLANLAYQLHKINVNYMISLLEDGPFSKFREAILTTHTFGLNKVYSGTFIFRTFQKCRLRFARLALILCILVMFTQFMEAWREHLQISTFLKLLHKLLTSVLLDCCSWHHV